MTARRATASSRAALDHGQVVPRASSGKFSLQPVGTRFCEIMAAYRRQASPSATVLRPGSIADANDEAQFANFTPKAS